MEFLALGLAGLLILSMLSRKESDGYCYVTLRMEDAKALLSCYSSGTRTITLNPVELRDESLIILIPKNYGEKDVIEYEQYQEISKRVRTMLADKVEFKRHVALVYKKDGQYFLTTVI